MTRRLLDTFAGAGGCSVGYARAGFQVTGVDIEPHPDYPYELIVADAMDVLEDRAFLSEFDVVHASPPCPRYSTITPAHTRDQHPDLIPPVRAALREWGGIYVIENVPGAARHMVNPVKVCGSSFGLEVRRHRFFESNAPLMSTPCRHAEQGTPIGVTGDHPYPQEYLRPDGTRRGMKPRDLAHGQRAMGIDWMTRWDDLTDAIPPAYCEFVGAQLLDWIEVAA
jgi:DNA (cytosine-5)-methyltransferase 1